jgi:hypothetical protein
MLNGIGVFIMLIMLFIWIGGEWRMRLAGYGALTDIGIHVLGQLLLGGAHEGRLAVLFGCVMFNLYLMTYRKVVGYIDSDGYHRGILNFRRNHGTSETR